jgi:uncharacterized membrane protein YfhO
MPVSSAGIFSYEPERVVVHVNAAAGGWLVLNDLDYPGWTATLDGQSVPVQTTNYALRGVCIPAGQHEIVFSFQPAILRWGAALTGLAVFLLFLALLSIWRAGRLGTPPLSAASADLLPSNEDYK